MAKRAEEIMRKVNVEGTRLLMEEAKRVGCKAFVHTSSAGVIGDMRNPRVNADEKFAYVRGKLQPEYYTDTKVSHAGSLSLLLSLSSSFRAGGASRLVLAHTNPPPRLKQKKSSLPPTSAQLAPPPPQPSSPPPSGLAAFSANATSHSSPT